MLGLAQPKLQVHTELCDQVFVGRHINKHTGLWLLFVQKKKLHPPVSLANPQLELFFTFLLFANRVESIQRRTEQVDGGRCAES